MAAARDLGWEWARKVHLLIMVATLVTKRLKAGGRHQPAKAQQRHEMGFKRPYDGHPESPAYASSNEEPFDEDDLSSDDSIDMTLGTTQPDRGSLSGQKYGIGAQLLEKMGHTPGTGLGIDGSGIVDPIEIEKRQNRAGLGMEVPEAPSRIPSGADLLTGKQSELAQNSKLAQLSAVNDELDLIRQQQSDLKQALDIIHVQGEDLDVLEFFELFGGKYIWHTEKLYEAPAAVFRLRIPYANAFDWLVQHPDVVLAANEVLPEGEWGSLLAEKWLQNATLDLPQLLNQWAVGRSHGFAAAGSYLSQMFSDPDVVRQAVTQGHEFLSRLLSLLPDVSYLVTELKRSVQSYSLEDQTTVLASVTFESAAIAKLVASSTNLDDLDDQSETLVAFSRVLNKEDLSRVLEKTRVREIWLDQLSARLQQTTRGNTADIKAWWLRWRPFFALFIEDSVEPWLQAGLDMINAVLDGVHQAGRSPWPTPRPPQPQTRAISTLKDVLDHVCYMNDFKMAPTPTGYLVRGSDRELELIIDNDVLLVRRSQSLIPVSLDALQSYLSKS